jgi:hypothetical protein
MPSLTRRALFFAAAGAVTLPFDHAFAADPILTVSGRIAGGGERSFTLADIESLPAQGFSTATPWHADVTAFEGVGLDVFLDHVGSTGSRLRLVALNDYAVEAEIADLAGKGAIFAYRENGRVMDVSDRGPLFLVFPFDSDPSLRHQSFYARCVWQLAAIEIL